ncbi:hypothetical protein VitviT2T_021643 [Vitis vinifera]|uniref:PEP-utilising enzyme mobile domain-containing protein n=1 Tax=Vitis vinifera TaxID=29760 RepID=A0ABY9DAE1_VITVI|nr:hypothetical protein VitviT2T_021643 [Vitis vinifera]
MHLLYLEFLSSALMVEAVQSLTDAAKQYLVCRYKDITGFQEEETALPLAGIEVVLSGCLLHAVVGILTARGGMISHAAVIACEWGKCYVSGCSEICVNDIEKVIIVGNKVIKEDDWISLNGSTGKMILGKQALVPLIRHLKVMNFASDERIKVVRKLIMAPAESSSHTTFFFNSHESIKFEVKKFSFLHKMIFERHEKYVYLRLVEAIISNNVQRDDKTRTGTLSKSGCQMRFNL